MPTVKTTKTKAYYKRFQTKFRRRREGRTDYYARQRLILQDKNKYGTRKYRFVVRATNAKIICQVIYAEMTGDRVLCEATSAELPRYGLKVGLKNYAASYCTGLLLARRLLKQLQLDEVYTGADEVNGELVFCEVEGRQCSVPEDQLDDEKRPFRCFLDVGVKATTTGARLFGAMKGAVDGGLDIPHNHKRFPGYDRESKDYSAEDHKARIMGSHVAEYMRHLQEENPEKYAAHFKAFEDAGVGPDELEELYTSVHQKIRENPDRAVNNKNYSNPRFKHTARRSLKQRKDRVRQIKAWMKSQE
jgi:large subunit ribosomal protein L5e